MNCTPDYANVVESVATIDVSSRRCELVEVLKNEAGNVIDAGRISTTIFGTVLLPAKSSGYQLIRGGRYTPKKDEDTIPVRSVPSRGIATRPTSRGFVTSKGR
jgi:hypothetical protein